MLGAGIFRTKLPLGFSVSGINSGVRLYRPDLGIIISDTPCVAAGVFTQNTYKGAPVQYCQDLLPANNIRAIITNSGEANTATGRQGVIDNSTMANAVAKQLNCEKEQILTASTGIIGKPLSIDKIVAAIPELCTSTTKIAEKFAVAILTTDLVPKTIHKEIKLSQGTIHITGICKGSGMIHPNMATMLGYLLTDANLDMKYAKVVLKKICDKSFNMISVDGETSTNDCVFLMANGHAKVELVTQEDLHQFENALLEIAVTLAKSIVRDGEGASKLIQAQVIGAITQEQAKSSAKSIITSLLIKTAIYGESPNWGPIIARLGGEELPKEMLTSCEIFLQGIKIFSCGTPVTMVDMDDLKQRLKEDTIDIMIDFVFGSESATAWGCDLTEKYVKINAEYLS